MGEKVGCFVSAELRSEPVVPLTLWVIGAGDQRLLIDAERRRALRAQLVAGTLDELVFEATVFRAEYPNANFLRFRDADLEAFAASYVGQPFLRDHDAGQIASRGGTIREAALAGREFVQQVALTVPRDMEAFLNGQMDRFSIAWYVGEAVLCSVCGNEWLSRDCGHWPGEQYAVGESSAGDAGKAQVLCELIFVKPRGKETSAVNTPAVAGTGIRGVLAELMAAKQALWRGDMHEDEVESVSRVGAVGGPAPNVAANVAPVPDVAVALAVPAPNVAVALAAPGGRADGGSSPVASGNGGSSDDVAALVAATNEVAVLLAQKSDEVSALLTAQKVSVLEARLAGSGLPLALQESVRDMLPPGWKLADLDNLLAVQRGLWAKLEAERTVQGHDAPRDGRVRGMMDSVDRLGEALTALIEGRVPQRGVRPLSGLREAYLLLSGDYEMVGVFRPEHVTLAAVDSSTMAGIVANAMNKVIVTEFQKYPRWWEAFVTTENFTNLQAVRWMTLGGVGELPTVNEGAAYTELSWDDQTETSNWVKKGGYLGLTLEAMDKDDVGRLRAAPRALAQSAWLTLGKAIAGIFTAHTHVGPTMSDGDALFHVNHGNLGTTAFDTAPWAACRLAMRKQTELNSGERLGALTAPKFLLVPPDLEQKALQVLGSEGLPGTANNDVNPEGQGDTHDARLAAARRRIIVMDLWTDSNNWAAVADPRMYASIGVGFRFGETPEIFSVASPGQGLMFTNDVMPVKVRYFFAVGPTDWRGIYKANVAG